MTVFVRNVVLSCLPSILNDLISRLYGVLSLNSNMNFKNSHTNFKVLILTFQVTLWSWFTQYKYANPEFVQHIAYIALALECMVSCKYTGEDKEFENKD